MKNSLYIKCPAKINLNLKIINKRQDGFHNIESIMQTINLFDILNIKISDSSKNEILLSGNSTQIPYNENNLAYKAAKLFVETFAIRGKSIEIYIEKNIPVAAGLAGGSTDAAGVLLALSKLFTNFKVEKNDLHNLCTKLGSDLNVCLQGGRLLCKGRGEIIETLPFKPFRVSLIKPIELGISAKEAYTKYNEKILKQHLNKKIINDLEWAIIDDYPQLQYIKQKYPNAVMTGSGSTFFMINEEFMQEEGYWVKNGLHAINCGVEAQN